MIRDATFDPDNAWHGFDPVRWGPFRQAWTARGFRLAPTRDQQRALFDVVDARPQDAGRWVTEAPRGCRADQVVAAVLARWHDYQADQDARLSQAEAVWEGAKADDRAAAADAADRLGLR